MDNLIHADCLDAMAAMEAESIDAIVTDPPYGLEFMGKEWDKLVDRRTDTPYARSNWNSHNSGSGPIRRHIDTSQAWHEAWAREAFRIAKPGAHLLAFGGTRTVHRLAAAIEDAGWEIRDMLVWGYASGFPKSLDVSKAIDKAAGAEREVTGVKSYAGGHVQRSSPDHLAPPIGTFVRTQDDRIESAPATPDAEKWNGWGTALKPAWEPIVMARKPLRGTVAANVLRHGTGALNIDGTRIAAPENVGTVWTRGGKQTGASLTTNTTGENEYVEASPLGRWPANVILTDPIFDGGVEGVVGGGDGGGGYGIRGRGGDVYGGGNGYTTDMPETGQTVGYGDSGTYSRFFLIPKSARSEREPVLGGLAEQDRRTMGGGLTGVSGDRSGRGGAVAPLEMGNAQRQNVHPTVKPLDLMRHLVRLVTPPGGTVLDPFLGSGTTALAAEMEGFAWIGIEKEAEYIAITEARLNGTQKGLGLVG